MSARRLLSPQHVRIHFDRGTLLIDAPRGAPALANLPYVLWDPRVGAHRAPAFEHQRLRAALDARSVRFSDDVRISDDLRSAWISIDLRPYQRAAVEAWELSSRRGLVVLPTGSGKTRVATSAISLVGRSALCIVPTIALLEQWIARLREVYAGPIGVLGDGQRTIESITVATFESAYRHMPAIGDRFSLLVIDEVHHFGCGMRDEALEMSTAPHRLGLTATCPREQGQLDRLARLVGPIVYELALTDLGGYLAPLERRVSMLELTPEERLAYRTHHEAFSSFNSELRRTNPQATWADFVRTASRSAAGRRALDGWRSMAKVLAYTTEKSRRLAEIIARHRGSRILAFCADNTTAYAVARDHLLMPITCDIGREERAEAFELLGRAAVRGLVSARVLNEGVDLPDADVAVVISASLGEREHIQRVGRVLRPSPDKRALLYELVTRGTIEVQRSQRRSRGLDPGKDVRVQGLGERAAPHFSLSRGSSMAPPSPR